MANGEVGVVADPLDDQRLPNVNIVVQGEIMTICRNLPFDVPRKSTHLYLNL